MARPIKHDLDEGIVYELAKMHCSMNEIAAAFGCSVDILERRYADIILRGREEGKTSLRRMQYLAAAKGNIAMLIWLGKQILHQTDKVDLTSKDGIQLDLKLSYEPIKDVNNNQVIDTKAVVDETEE